MFGRVGNMVRSALGAAPVAPQVGGNGLVPLPTSRAGWNATLTGFFGPPQSRTDPTHDRAVAQVYSPPYQGPLDLDRWGGETEQARRDYRDQYSRSPVFRAAIKGKANDIASLEPTVHVSDKTDVEANDAAEFIKRTIEMSPGGFPGVIDNIYLPGSLDGFSVCEWKLEEQIWHQRPVWGLSHLRPLDTIHVRFQLDVYYNVIGVVNMVRGLDYYDPKGYVLYSHHGLFNSPFGQSDGRAAIEAARDISDVYKLWYIALKIYGLPYMVGNTTAQNRKLMETALTELRAGGWAVTTGEKDKIELLNMAVGAALNGFESFINVKRQDIFYGTRLAALPFLEGKGGQDAHGSSKIEQGTSDAGEKMDAHRVADVLNRQLVPRLLEPNYNLPRHRMPQIKLGGTDWEQTKKIIEVIKEAQDIGLDPSAEWARQAAGVQASRGPEDKLVSAQDKQQQQQAQQQAAAQPIQGAPAAPQPTPAPTPPTPEVPPAGFSAGVDDAVVWLPTSRLAADPKRFQFRRGHDTDDGTVRELPSERFDAQKCEPLAVWHDPQRREDFVVDGHHRLAWAERDGAKRVPVHFISARTAEEAKEQGRRLNTRLPARSTYSAATTFSAGHKPGVDPAQLARCVNDLLAELTA
jgi:Protein of unknown function (DUF935)